MIKNVLTVKVKRLHPDAEIPKKMTDGSAGFDLTAISKVYENNRVIYDFGLAFEIPKGYFMAIIPRSSIYKKDLYLTNSFGCVDSDFRGSVKAIFKYDPEKNSEYTKDTYNIGDRVAQAFIIPFPQIKFEEVTDLSETTRGKGGFGHTGN